LTSKETNKRVGNLFTHGKIKRVVEYGSKCSEFLCTNTDQTLKLTVISKRRMEAD